MSTNAILLLPDKPFSSSKRYFYTPLQILRQIWQITQNGVMRPTVIYLLYLPNLQSLYLQCEPFLFIFSTKPIIKLNLTYELRNRSTKNVCMYLQCHYRPPNSRNGCRRSLQLERPASPAGCRNLLRMLQRFGCFFLNRQQCTGSRKYRFRHYRTQLIAVLDF